MRFLRICEAAPLPLGGLLLGRLKQHGLRGIPPRRLRLGRQGRDLHGAGHLISGKTKVAGGFANATRLTMPSAILALRRFNLRNLRRLIGASIYHLDPSCEEFGALDLAEFAAVQVLRDLGGEIAKLMLDLYEGNRKKSQTTEIFGNDEEKHWRCAGQAHRKCFRLSRAVCRRD